jgi:hypothetical protein
VLDPRTQLHIRAAAVRSGDLDDLLPVAGARRDVAKEIVVDGYIDQLADGVVGARLTLTDIDSDAANVLKSISVRALFSVSKKFECLRNSNHLFRSTGL